MRAGVPALAAAAAILLSAAHAEAADLFQQGGSWASLAGDRAAARVGDALTVIIDENSAASNSAQNASNRTSHLGGQITGGAFSRSGSLDLGSAFGGQGQTARSHKMVAQFSVVVEQVLPNGDLIVSGAEALRVNGERTNIRVKGRVRPEDIGSDNTILSTRLADAVIDYDGAGFVASSARPGLLTRIFNWIGVP